METFTTSYKWMRINAWEFEEREWKFSTQDTMTEIWSFIKEAVSGLIFVDASWELSFKGVFPKQ